eukprot:scaffold877_cov154-Amphora_coffeaeformis.AAC.3
MSIGPGYQGGRTRVGTKVFLNVYDLAPANDYLYQVGMGFHHSGVEIMGSEYSFASGAGVFDSTPKHAPGARFREQIEMGSFEGGQAELKKALDDMREEFSPDDYNLIRKNCNHFSAALCWRLLGKRIPAHVNRLADLGVCCSCLLPRQLVEHAPVGDPNPSSSSSSGFLVKPGSLALANNSSTSVKAFEGQGKRLGSTTSSSSLTPNGSQKGDELTDRREKARKAALARLERNQQGDMSS